MDSESRKIESTPPSTGSAGDAGAPVEGAAGSGGAERSPSRGRLVGVLRIVGTVALIGYLASTISFGEVWRIIREADQPVLLLAFALHFVGFTLSTIRWRVLLSAVVQPVCGHLPLMRAYLIGMFCNQFLPSTIGGDVYRAMDAAELNGLDRGRSLAIVFIERLIGAAALFAYALLALVVGFGRFIDKPGVVASIAAIGGGFLLVTLALTTGGRRIIRRVLEIGPLRKILPAVERAFGAVKDLGRQRRAIAIAGAISLVFQLNVVMHYLLVGHALELPVPDLAYFLAVPIVLLVLQLPFSVNGIGMREATFALFLGPTIWEPGATLDQAVAFGIVVYVMIVLQGALGGVFFALRRRSFGQA